ncbi:MAG: hypothetical protein S4CHLAM123_15350 [Chlamydiales bacterium]|nr:hypothetical protein [Chlamydiales bacterium]
MTLSVITPTGDREHFLKGCYKLLQKQNYTDWEWLVYDTSLRPVHFEDPRVIYIHDENILSIGEKRRRLVEWARGEVIVHFDDDDYYAPTYLDTVVKSLEEADCFSFYSWFSYDLKTRQVHYWARNERADRYYVLNPLGGNEIREVGLPARLKDLQVHKNHELGYGFSFAYRKEVAKNCTFPDCDLMEDRYFFRAAEKAGFRFNMVADQLGEAVHVIHDSNTSSESPQYRIPHFLLAEKFTDFFAHIELYHED